MASKVLIAAGLALICFIAGASALKCVTCTSASSSCGEGMTDDDITSKSMSCVSGFTSCLKTVTESGDAEAYGRSCGVCPDDKETDVGGVKTTIHCCDTDDCNSARSLVPALTMLITSLLFTALF